MHKQVFLDYASCTPVREEVYETYIKLVKTCFMNSEALYSGGMEVHTLVEKSRNQIAKLLGTLPEEIIFTSGASEANSFAVKGYCLKNKHKGKHIITSSMEHSSVMQSIKQLEEEFGFEVEYLPVYEDGKIALEDVKKAMREDTILVSIMSVNNEIGSIQDINGIAQIVHQSTKCKLHVDAVQSIGKITLTMKNIDMMSITAHKLYGVKGCGVLVCKKNIKLLPIINGGQQERGNRGGTLNASSCIVFAKTLRLALEEQVEHYEKIAQLNTYLREKLEKMSDIYINSNKECCPHILNFSCISMGSEIMMNALNSKGICVSSQSTCSSRTKAPSHTLAAMNMKDEIKYGAIRVSISHVTKKEELDYFISSIKEIIDEYRTK